MPNIIAHMMVGSEAARNLEPAFLLGCALPDFRGMYRDYAGVDIRLEVIRPDSPLADGIRLHYAADRAYDSIPEVRSLKQTARHNLGYILPAIGSGAVRACADAGTDILLDGALWGQGKTQQMFERVREGVVHGNALAECEPEQPWKQFVSRYFAEYASERYMDPAHVATMLQRRFSNRRGGRLAFMPEQIPAVTEVFVHQLLRLHGAAGRLIEFTAEALTYQEQP